MLSFLKIITAQTLDFFFPPECLGCSEEDYWVCPKCCSDLSLHSQKIDHPLPELQTLWILAEYQNRLIARIIKRLKFYYCQEILSDLDVFFASSLKMIPLPKDAVLCPIPLHLFRRNERGFNQSEVLAQVFSQHSGLPIKNMLQRVRHTKAQSSLGAEARKKNLTNAFALNQNESCSVSRATPIIIVDDVSTTMTTLREAAKVLRKEGFENIFGIVLARSIEQKKK